MDTMFGDLPVLERWTRRRNVRGGWRGLRENGEKVFVEAGYSAVQNETEQRVIVKSQQYVASIPADDRMINIKCSTAIPSAHTALLERSRSGGDRSGARCHGCSSTPIVFTRRRAASVSAS
jgi:hypothetical protein